MGFFSSLGSAISSACSYVGSAISSAASWAGGALSAVVSAGGSLIGGVANMAGSLLRGLGIFSRDDPPTEGWGDRAIQAEEQKIFPDSFDDFPAYLDALRNFSLDPDKTKESTLEEKQFKGLEVAGRALEDKFNAPEGSMANVFYLAAANPAYFTSERFESLLNSGADVAAVAAYFDGKLGGAESLDIENELIDLDQKANPGSNEQTSRAELYEAVETAQHTIRNILN